MNTKTIGIVVAVVVVAAAAYFIFGNKTPSTPEATQVQSQTGTFRELAASRDPQKCAVTSSANGVSSTGTVYVAPGLMRGDFTSSGTAAGTIESHMIVKDNVSYVWSSASAAGFKMTLPSAANGQENTSASLSYDQQVNYSCEAWTPDQSQFALPTGISFSDVSQIQSGSAGAAAGTGMKGTAEQCRACNSLSGAQKAQCLVALSCQ